MIDKLIGPVSGLLDKFIEDKDQKARLAHDLATMADQHAQELAKGQLEVNKVEAAHKSLFVSLGGGQRSDGFAFWVCLATSSPYPSRTLFLALLIGYDIVIPLSPISKL